MASYLDELLEELKKNPEQQQALGISQLDTYLKQKHDPEIKQELARRFLEGHDVNTAFNLVQEILDEEKLSDETKGESLFLRGQLYGILGFPEAEISDYLEAYILDEREEYLKRAAWLQLTVTEDFEAATRNYRWHLKRPGEDRAEIAYPLGAIAMNEEDWSKARYWLSVAYTSVGDNETLKGDILIMQGELERRLVDEQTPPEEWWDRMKRSLNCYREARDLGISDPDFWFNMAEMELEVAGREDAARYFLSYGMVQEWLHGVDQIGEEQVSTHKTEEERDMWKLCYHLM